MYQPYLETILVIYPEGLPAGAYSDALFIKPAFGLDDTERWGCPMKNEVVAHIHRSGGHGYCADCWNREYIEFVSGLEVLKE